MDATVEVAAEFLQQFECLQLPLARRRVQRRLVILDIPLVWREAVFLDEEFDALAGSLQCSLV